jgi:hypothetical protein
MTNTQHISLDDLSLFAMQLLPEPEMQAVARHLKECSVCREELAALQSDLVLYALTAEMQAPPSQARERLLAQVSKEKKLIPVDRVEQQIEPVLYPRNSRMFQMEAPEPKRSKTAAALAWTGWAVAAGLAVATGLQFQQREQLQQNLSVQTAKLNEVTGQSARAKEVLETLTDAGAMQVSMHIPVNPNAPLNFNPTGHAAYIPSKGSLVFVASHLDPLQQYKTYELWLLSADGQAIPAGLFKPDANGNASVVMPDLPKGILAKGFGVTVEDDGGSKTPTAPIVLAGM